MAVRLSITIRTRYIAAIAVMASVMIGFLLYKAINQILPSRAIYLVDEIASPARRDRVLVFSPHPDDESLGVAGFLHDAVAAGGQVHVVVVTDGNKHGLKSLREQETLSAMAILGITQENVTFLGYPDGRLKENPILNAQILRTIEDFKPTIIFTTDKTDRHSDHAVTGKAVVNALKTSHYRGRVYGYLVHFPRFPHPQGLHPQVHLLPPPRLIVSDNQWLRFSLSEETEKIKERAIRQYRSQLKIKNMPLRNLLLSFVRKNELFSSIQ